MGNEANEAMLSRQDAERASMDGVEWLTWQAHRRTENIADYFDIPVTVVSSKSKGIVRYLHASFGTLQYLLRRRPRVLIVQNPSLVLTLLAVLLRPLFRYRLVVDAHNEAVQPFINTQPIMVTLSKWLLRQADLTIVTNQHLADVVQNAGGVPGVLPDRLPNIRPSRMERSRGKLRAVLIATFASDEPIAEVLEAASRITGKMELYVTGRLKDLPESTRKIYSGSVTFTDFLPEKEYWELLDEADFIVDLTLMDDCLVCGAYEAVALGKPAMLSDNKATRDYFHKGAVYVGNTVDSLVIGMELMITSHGRLSAEVLSLKEELAATWPGAANKVRYQILEGIH